MEIKVDKIPAVILAGGLASRMGGRDKGLLEINGATILERAFAILKPQVGEVIINANGDLSRFDRFAVSVIPDSLEGHLGPLSGILAGMDWAASIGSKHIVSVAADTPFFPTDLVHKLTTAVKLENADIGLAQTFDKVSGHKIRHPTFGLWSVSLRNELRVSLSSGLRKVVLWTDQYSVANVLFGEGSVVDPFFNVNTPNDLNKANMIAMGLD